MPIYLDSAPPAIVHHGEPRRNFDTHAEFKWGGMQHVFSRALENNGSPACNAPFGTTRQWHLNVSFNHPKFGRIIGLRGQTIKRLQDVHGVHLHTEFERHGADGAVPISGPIGGIDACMRDLSRILGEIVTIVPEERDEFNTLVGRVPTKTMHGHHAGPPPLPPDASPELQAARALRLWVLNRDDKCISDLDTNLFYDTIKVGLKEAIKAIKLKGLIEKCVPTLHL
jgi:hypothetical protein